VLRQVLDPFWLVWWPVIGRIAGHERVCSPDPLCAFGQYPEKNRVRGLDPALVSLLSLHG
jgi:hypothetical protein